MTMISVDIVIVGAGPIGLACGIELQKYGLNYLILEKGCLVNSIYNFPNDMTFFNSSARLEIDEIPFTSINPKPSKNEALEYYRRVVNYKKLNLSLFDEVLSINLLPSSFYEVITNKYKYYSKYVIICTGFFDTPKKLNIAGENLDKVTHYYRDSHQYAFQKTLIIGYNNSAVIAALEILKKGGDVSMSIRGKSFKDSVKYWLRPNIENQIRDGLIKVYFNSEVIQINKNNVILREGDKVFTLENDFVVAMTGYEPNFEFLKKNGIKIIDNEYKTPKYNKENMETDSLNMFLAGTVCGGLNTSAFYIENSLDHAKKIAQTIYFRNQL